MEADNQFYTKCFFERKDTKNNYLVYAPFPKPDVKDNHLEDTLLYSKRFFVDSASLLSLDLGIDEKYKAVIAINYSCNDDFSSILEQYISFDYKIDQEYRNFYYKFDNLDDTYIFEGLRELVENIYTNEYLNKLIPKWNIELQEEDVFTKLPLQIDFYDSNVQNAKERTVVIISDAMRYEVGQELYSNLADDPKCMAKLDKQLSVLPSYTRLGMAALLPHDNIIITDNYQVLVDDVLCDNLLGRQTVLQKHSPNSICVQFDDIKNLKKAELRDIFTGKQIIYIYHNQIDARGDKANTYHFIITADHGFIYKRDKVTESDKISGVNDKNAFVNRRFIVADNAVNEDGITSISIGRVLRNQDIKVGSFPISSNVFKVSGGGQNLVHGGSSPQEVPVLDVKMERGHMDTKNASIALISMVQKITNKVTMLDFLQSEPVSDTIKATKYKIFFISEDNEKISNEISFFADSRETDTQKRIFHMKFQFKDKRYDKDKKYYLVVLDESTGEESFRHMVIMDLVFEDVF